MTTPARPATVDTADLAVVVVHGVGAQDVGSTLIAWAEPILQELREYVENRGGTLRYGPAQLHSDPAQVSVHYDLGDHRTKTWTFLEARWATAFPWPGSADVLRWGGRFTPPSRRSVSAAADAADPRIPGRTQRPGRDPRPLHP